MKINAIFAAALATAFLVSSPAAPKKTNSDAEATPPKKEEPKKNTYPVKGEVVKVTAFAMTLKGATGQPDRDFAFTENTKIVNGERPANLVDIKVGRKVGGVAKKAYKVDDQLLSVNVGVKQDDSPYRPDEIAPSKSTDKSKSTKTAKKKKPQPAQD